MRGRTRPNQLALLRGGGMSHNRSTEDPDAPATLLASIKHWHLGKKYALPGGNAVVLPWMCMELIDQDMGEVIHPIDALTPEHDDEELAFEVWERCKQLARQYDDGVPHRVKLVCMFSSEDNSAETFETWVHSITVPTKTPEYGMRTSAQARLAHGVGRPGFGGRPGMATHPHHSDQEIEWMALAQNGTHEVMQHYKDIVGQLSAANKAYADSVQSVMALQRELNNDKNKQRIERFESRVKMGALRVVAERFSKIGPPAAMQFMKWMADKRLGGGGGRAKTEREELAFRVMKVLALKIQGGDKSADGFLDKLKMMGIDEDDPIVDDIKRLMLEYAVDTQTRKLEEEAGGALVPNKMPNPDDPEEGLPIDGDDDEDDEEYEGSGKVDETGNEVP